MDLEFDTLKWCKTPLLERLARRLGVSLPAPGASYHRQLARRVAEGIEYDKRRAAAEEQRMKDKAEALKVAVEIAAALGETGERPRAQIGRIVVLMGPEWTWEQATYATGFHADLSKAGSVIMRDVGFRKDGTPRPLGGVFFAWCRRAAAGHVVPGGISRRDYFRCFTDRPKKPRPAPVSTRKAKAAPKPDPHAARARVQGKRAVPPVEVYVARRRA